MFCARRDAGSNRCASSALVTLTETGAKLTMTASIPRPLPGRNGASPALCASVVTTLLLAGCATDRQQTQAEGAAVGALAGAVLGSLLGGNRDGAAVGALLGAGVGAVAADKVADQKATYIQREDTLRASADQAQKLAQKLRDGNDALGREIAALDASVQRLRTERLTTESRRNLAQSQQQSLTALVGRVTRQLAQVRQEIAQQTTVVQAEERHARESKQPAPEQGIRLVAAGIRDLQGQERALDRARLQLQQIDQRRAY